MCPCAAIAILINFDCNTNWYTVYLVPRGTILAIDCERDLSYRGECCSRRTARTRGAAREARRHQSQQAQQHVDPRRRHGVPRDPALCQPRQWHHAGTGSGGPRTEAYAAVEYADHDNFIPFILETGGRVNKAARDWLDALTAPEPGEHNAD